MELDNKSKQRMWTDETEHAIIKLWQQNIKELSKTRNSDAYLKIANALGGRYTPKEIHSKISIFTQKYRNEKKRISTYGGTPTWKYYNKVGRILDKECESNFMKELEELCEGDQCSVDFSPLPSTSTSSPVVSSPPIQVFDSPLPVPSTSSPLAPLRLALSPVPESISEFSASRPSKRKLVNSLTLQKDVLKISKENQTILREQSAFSRNMAKEQFDLAKRSLKLLEENTQNSKYFATKIVEISEQQLKLEKNFVKIMKKVVKKIDVNNIA